MLRRRISVTAAGVAALALVATPLVSHAADDPLSGAIFTTDNTGVPVNLNIYPSKEAVYLNGGPGINAPADAAGLPAGEYTFQVTDPSGKTVLSSDALNCRRVNVDASGVFTSVVVTGCEHHTDLSQEHGGITVQLFPYDDTPNNGGVYKVWLTRTADLACTEARNPDCFVPSLSKTDNFKVRQGPIVEIDTRFWKDGVSQPLDGMKAVWTDTLGATNTKYSEYNPRILAFHEAHVEAAEQGTHKIKVSDQAGCTIDSVTTPTGATVAPSGGTATVKVAVKNHNAGDKTYFVDVHCKG